MYQHGSRPRQNFFQRHQRMAVPILLVLLLLSGAFLVYVVSSDERDDTDESAGTVQQATPEEQQPEEPVPELPSVQAELDQVLTSVRGTHSVLVEDLETGAVLASHRPDETYFTASIYKLYVAYLGLIDIQEGVHNPDEPYNQGRTRIECIEVMLRDSDSPCPEQMWEEQGRDIGNQRLQDLGLTNTDLLAITTTTQDANTILKRLYEQTDLTEEHTELFRNSLRDYPEREFREGLPAAFSEATDITVYNKPGLYDEGWLDVAIIMVPNGREVAVSIFSDSAYHQEVRTIADAIITPLTED